MNLYLLVTFYLAISFRRAENFHPPAVITIWINCSSLN